MTDKLCNYFWSDSIQNWYLGVFEDGDIYKLLFLTKMLKIKIIKKTFLQTSFYTDALNRKK